MKKITKILIISIIIISLVLAFAFSSMKETNAMSDKTYSVPYDTYTLGTSNRLVKTQTAFIPIGTISFKDNATSRNVSITAPQDIYYMNGLFYIATTYTLLKSNNTEEDTSPKSSVIVANNKGEVSRIIDTINIDGLAKSLSQVCGVFADNDYVYIADKGNSAVYKIDNLNNAVMVITKPTSELYGINTPFSPTKVVVQSNGSYYIIGDGTTTGVIEMNYAGEFIGFLGINTVSQSFQSIMYNLFFGDEGVASSQPASPTNVALGEKSSVLTTNSTVNTETIKRLNIDGINTFTSDTYYPTVSLSDITMSNENYIYSVSSTGDIFEYDRSGSLLFTFSTRDFAGTKVLGLTSSPTGIAVDENNNIYITDSQYNNVQIYQKTVFVTLVHKAVSLYNEGKYEESKPVWEEIIRQNTSFAKAHSALGMALYKEGNFTEALNEFSLAKDFNGYSDAYWEIRNIYIQNNSILIFGLIILLVLVLSTIKILKKKTNIFSPFKKFKEKMHQKRLIRESFYALHIIKHPGDTFYGIKRQNSASILSAVIVFVVFLIVYTINFYFQGVLFKSNTSSQGAILNILTVAGVILLYIICNYFISTLNDGEGRFKDIFISTIYSLTPFILLTLPMTIISHGLTYNESVIITIYNVFVIGWCAILLIMSISEIHNYSFWETIKCILLTLFAMIIVILFVLLIYTFISQMIDFVSSVIKEVTYRG